MSSPYRNAGVLPAGPLRNAEAVTPSDSADLDSWGFIFVGAAGDLKVDTVGGQTVTLKAVAGLTVPVYVQRVYATGTTATDLVVLY